MSEPISVQTDGKWIVFSQVADHPHDHNQPVLRVYDTATPANQLHAWGPAVLAMIQSAVAHATGGAPADDGTGHQAKATLARLAEVVGYTAKDNPGVDLVQFVAQAIQEASKAGATTTKGKGKGKAAEPPLVEPQPHPTPSEVATGAGLAPPTKYKEGDALTLTLSNGDKHVAKVAVPPQWDGKAWNYSVDANDTQLTVDESMLAPLETPKFTEPATEDRVITMDERKEAWAYAESLGLDQAKYGDVLQDLFGKKSTEGLLLSQLAKLREALPGKAGVPF